MNLRLLHFLTRIKQPWLHWNQMFGAWFKIYLGIKIELVSQLLKGHINMLKHFFSWFCVTLSNQCGQYPRSPTTKLWSSFWNSRDTKPWISRCIMQGIPLKFPQTINPGIPPKVPQNITNWLSVCNVYYFSVEFHRILHWSIIILIGWLIVE